ncbi:MAG: hypothetical protein JKY94_06090 [Rhodobacteraceae bacterium]|nr:hypothetical protein [Paracoccaceae bacterium]
MAVLLIKQYFDFAYGLVIQFYALRRGEIVFSGDRESVSREDMPAAVSV